MYAKYGCQTTVALYLVCYWTTGRFRPITAIGLDSLIGCNAAIVDLACGTVRDSHLSRLELVASRRTRSDACTPTAG